MYFILFYKTVDDYLERRIQYRERHLNYAMDSHNRGELIIAGAYSEPADGAVLIFKAESSTIVEDFAKNDPYVIYGLVVEWTVRKWTVVIGGD
ncbi:MAG: YCII-related protein [Ignavibacteria bacterium]|nr:YCII-related protein [Ignavibacteria bacterium]